MGISLQLCFLEPHLPLPTFHLDACEVWFISEFVIELSCQLHCICQCVDICLNLSRLKSRGSRVLSSLRSDDVRQANVYTDH